MITYLLKYLRRFIKESKAFLRGEKFYCTSLSGKSDYGIAVNSDLTVSCNCSDLYGYGKIGDLRYQEFDEILAGKTASLFRRKLSKGRIPIIDCVACQNLHKSKQVLDINEFASPDSVLLENTVNCNLNCLGCRRRSILKNRTSRKINLDEMELVSSRLRNGCVKKIYYFNQGEPFTSSDIKKEIQIVKKHNPNIELITSTNGMLIDTQEKREAALMFDLIFISVDGPDQDTVSRYQRGADFQKVYSNMKELVRLRGSRKTPVIEWKYVLFRWNDREHQLTKADRLAREAGIDVLSFWKTTFPAYAVSFRYFLGFEYFEKYGTKSWKGREIDYRNPQSSI